MTDEMDFWDMCFSLHRDARRALVDTMRCQNMPALASQTGGRSKKIELREKYLLCGNILSLDPKIDNWEEHSAVKLGFVYSGELCGIGTARSNPLMLDNGWSIFKV